MKARVFVTLKPTVLDPQGQAIRAALNGHGHPTVAEVRQGKFFDLTVTATNAEEARAEVEKIAHEVLSNPVIEEYRVELAD